jgi:hypothetical protein
MGGRLAEGAVVASVAVHRRQLRTVLPDAADRELPQLLARLRPRPPATSAAPAADVRATKDFYEWPETFPGWPSTIDPEDPKIRYP